MSGTRAADQPESAGLQREPSRHQPPDDGRGHSASRTPASTSRSRSSTGRTSSTGSRRRSPSGRREHAYRSDRDLVVLTTGNAYLVVISDHATVDSTRAQVTTAQALHDRAVDRNKAGVIAAHRRAARPGGAADPAATADRRRKPARDRQADAGAYHRPAEGPGVPGRQTPFRSRRSMASPSTRRSNARTRHGPTTSARERRCGPRSSPGSPRRRRTIRRSPRRRTTATSEVPTSARRTGPSVSRSR